MAAKGIYLKGFHIRCQACARWIQVNIPDQFRKIGIRLAQDGFVTILEKMPVPPVSAVEGNHISG